MKGYLVGYFEEWADNRNPIIIGYYTTFSKAMSSAVKLEHTNQRVHGGKWAVHVVDVNVNKTYANRGVLDWIDNFDYQILKTVNGSIITERVQGLTQNSAQDSTQELPKNLMQNPTQNLTEEWIPVTKSKRR